jgi:hypothetical protein
MASTPMSMSTAEELWAFASQYVAAMNRHFGDGAGEHLRDMIRTGAGALDDIADPANREARIDEAKRALAELLDKAAEMAVTIDGYPDDLLGERSYFPALGWFCPRWPFCR